MLLATPRGRKLRDDPVGLWWHLAGQLPPTKIARHVTHAGLLLFAATAIGSAAGDDPLEYVARMLNEAGWQNRDGTGPRHDLLAHRRHGDRGLPDCHARGRPGCGPGRDMDADADVARHPAIAGLAALAILVPLAIPLFSLNLGQQDVAALSTSTTARQAYDLISDNFGPGVNGPLLVAVSLGSPAQGSGDPRLQTLQKDISSTPGVAAITPVQIDQAGTTAYFNVIATTGPAEQATANLVSKLRSDVIPAADKGTNMTAYVGGSTASNVDLAAEITSRLLLQILVVIALSFLLLMLAFRTVVVPVQAAVMNLLSIGAAYGVLTAIFQFGWAHSAIGLDGAVPIVSFVPLFMFAVLFERFGHVGGVEAAARSVFRRAFLVERPDPAAVLFGRFAAPGGAPRVGDARAGGQDLFDDEIVPPVVAEVVRVHDLGLLIGGHLGKRDR